IRSVELLCAPLNDIVSRTRFPVNGTFVLLNRCCETSDLTAHESEVLAVALLREHREEEILARANPPAKRRTAKVRNVVLFARLTQNLAVNFQPGLVRAAFQAKDFHSRFRDNLDRRRRQQLHLIKFKATFFVFASACSHANNHTLGVAALVKARDNGVTCPVRIYLRRNENLVAYLYFT